MNLRQFYHRLGWPPVFGFHNRRPLQQLANPRIAAPLPNRQHGHHRG
jgi:hypothetical protein